MNRDQEDRYGRQHESSFHTHRSERYRHPERDSGYRSDDYGSSARSGYGNAGEEMHGSRRYTDIHVTPYDRFEQSHNYGSMGSYGGAQGFGDVRGGRHDSGHPYDSGMSSPRMDRGQDYNPRGYGSFGSESYNRGGNYGRGQSSAGGGFRRSQEDLYGRDTSRRFQGSRGQGRYDFERDDYYSSNYGDDQGNYMGSGYNRMTQSNYGTGDYGSSGYMEPGRRDRDRDRDRDRGSGSSREFNTAQNRWNTDW